MKKDIDYIAVYSDENETIISTTPPADCPYDAVFNNIKKTMRAVLEDMSNETR